MLHDRAGHPRVLGRRVLGVSADPDVRAELMAVCAEAGVPVDTRSTAPPLVQWCAAVTVLLDHRFVDRLGHLPRRTGVVVVQPGGEAGDAHATVPSLGERPRPDSDDDGVLGSPTREGHLLGGPGQQVWRDAVAVGAEHVVVLPTGRGWLVETVRRACRPRGRSVATVGARGGAGATSTAVALATAAAQAGHRSVLLDLDPRGGGVDLALGAEDLPGMRWPDLHDVRPPLPPGGLSTALPTADGVVLLSHGRDPVVVDPEAAVAVVEAALDEHDLVVLDLPRAGDPAAEAASLLADVLLCVSPAEVRAGAAASQVLQRFPGPADLHLLVRGPSPGGLRPADAAAAIGAGLTGRPLQRVDLVRAEPGLAAALERGEAFAVAARSPLRRWAARWVADEVPGAERAR